MIVTSVAKISIGCVSEKCMGEFLYHVMNKYDTIQNIKWHNRQHIPKRKLMRRKEPCRNGDKNEISKRKT